jgi:hypothetical protein
MHNEELAAIAEEERKQRELEQIAFQKQVRASMSNINNKMGQKIKERFRALFIKKKVSVDVSP